MVKFGLLGAAMLFGVVACSDDHFDVVTSSTSNNGATIWENIEADASLSSAASILKKCRVMTTETDKSAKQTFAELLNSSQEMTAWIPQNGTFDAESYLSDLQKAEELIANEATQTEGYKKLYNVSYRFARNHIARFNYESNRGDQRVRMMNGKLVTYNATTNKFNGQDIVGSTVFGTNGALHTLSAASPFAYNIYEYISENDTLSQLNSMIEKSTTYTFSSGSSTEGTMNPSGQMEYVDSAYTRSNTLLSGANLNNISNEDSTYVTILPTNQCYQTARDEIVKLYKYAKNYNYTWDSSKNEYSYKGTNALGGSDKFDFDSLQRVNVSTAILKGTTFSVTELPETVDKTTKEGILNYVLTADSLKTVSNGFFIYNAANDLTTPDHQLNPNPIFDGQGVADAVQASNGYIFLVDNYNYAPASSYAPKLSLSGDRTSQVTGSVSTSGVMTTLNADNLNPDIDISALGDDDYYYYYRVSGNSQINIDFRLDNVMSTKYRISVVMLPNWVNTYNIADETKPETPKFNAELRDDKGSTIGKKITNIQVPQDKATEIVLWDAFEFPYSYAGLPSNNESFPVLRLSMTYAQQRSGNCKALSIYGVRLVPVTE